MYVVSIAANEQGEIVGRRRPSVLFFNYKRLTILLSNFSSANTNDEKTTNAIHISSSYYHHLW